MAAGPSQARSIWEFGPCSGAASASEADGAHVGFARLAQGGSDVVTAPEAHGRCGSW